MALKKQQEAVLREKVEINKKVCADPKMKKVLRYLDKSYAFKLLPLFSTVIKVLFFVHCAVRESLCFVTSLINRKQVQNEQ